jgi:hypothetical protein
MYQQVAARVEAWRAGGYACDEYPVIAEILEWAQETESGNLRFLRRPQLHALEVYWYLRLIEKTPHVFDLYTRYYPKPRELREAIALASAISWVGIEALALIFTQIFCSTRFPGIS